MAGGEDVVTGSREFKGPVLSLFFGSLFVTLLKSTESTRSRGCIFFVYSVEMTDGLATSDHQNKSVEGIFAQYGTFQFTKNFTADAVQEADGFELVYALVQ